MRFYFSFSIFLIVLVLIDLYSFKAIRIAMKKSVTRQVISIAFWALSVVLYVMVGTVLLNKPDHDTVGRYASISIIFGILLLFLLPKLMILVFHFFDDIQFLIRKLIVKLRNRKTPRAISDKGRRAFLTKTGIVLAALPFTSVMYGIFKGRFNFSVYSESIAFKNLPGNFDGLKLVQFSDFHLGSFSGNYEQVEAAIELINQQEPDLLVFTGDLVNNSSHEIDEFLPLLKKLNARYGKYSILGNHDYGDYSKWDSDADKQTNFERMISLQEEAGFELLRNENRQIQIGDESIKLVGLENWGHPPFPQYGDLRKAMQGVDEEKFTLLLSHDPSHWDAEVLGKTRIDLTLAGHTHGMQFGIEIPGFKFSPIQFKYPRWGGLYTEGKQHLYVNRGIGYIGIAARVGINPEVAVLELRKEA
ncbi:MAG: metallophosphoesterase [Bacteroidales bacterium]|nr:metallophosphoesterase [Bacteroidales bacterium]MCF8456059.1 metallophosphoesterase [Bacteroidales bacterium]